MMKDFECSKCGRFIYTDTASQKIESMVFENKSLRQRLAIAEARLNMLRNAIDHYKKVRHGGGKIMKKIVRVTAALKAKSLRGKFSPPFPEG